MSWRLLAQGPAGSSGVPLLIAAGCSSTDSPASEGTRRAAQAVISDQLHNGGTSGFPFLPPMVPRPAQYGDFLPTVSPTVRIDEVTAAGVTVRTLATFTATSGPGDERLRIHHQGSPRRLRLAAPAPAT